MKDSEKIEKVREIVMEQQPHGDRYIVVLDRGWVFVGDLIAPCGTTQTYTLTRAKNIRCWKQGGFGGLTNGAKASGATLDDCADIIFEESAMILRVKVGGDWDA